METGVIFKRDEICREYGISRNFFYALLKVPGSPLKKIAGGWAVEVEQMKEFIRNYEDKEKESEK